MMRVDSRRLVRAIVLTAVLFLLVGGGVGFVVAAGEPEALVVPEPRPGDRVVYDVQRTIIDADLALGDLGDTQLNEVSYQWLAERWTMSDEFGVRLARPLRATYGFMLNTPSAVLYERVILYDAVDGRVLSQEYSGRQTASTDFQVGPVTAGSFLKTTSESQYLNNEYDFERDACGTWTALHGTPYDGTPVTLRGHCGWGNRADDLLFHADGWMGEGLDREFQFTADRDARLRIAYSPEHPFPTRMHVSMAEIIDPDWALGRLFRLELRAFERGTTGYTDVDPATLPPEPGPVGQAPVTAWMLDDAGMEAFVPFTLQQAYTAALADQSVPSVAGGQQTTATWLNGHPDAVLVFAVTLEYHNDQGETMPQWLLLWVDGDAWLGKRVSWEAAQGGFILPALIGREAQVTDWTPTWLPEDVDTWFPDRRQVPDRLARPAEMVPHYYTAFGPDAQLNRYGFQVMCSTPTCGTLDVRVEVGRHTEEAESDTDPTDPGIAYVDKLLVGQDGRALYRTQHQQSTGALVPITDSGSGTQPPPVTPAVAVPLWVLPDAPAATTGISFLALLVGALYYFWPALKGVLGFGLFSRIADDKVLDHPTRRRIHEAIEAEPGIHFQALARQVEVGRGTLEHHLRKLTDAELVTVRRAPGYTCYFPKGKVDRHFLDAAPALRSDGSRAVLQAVAAKPGTSSRDLAAHLGIAPSTVSYHLKRLETAGLVTPGEKAGVRITPLGTQAQATT